MCLFVASPPTAQAADTDLAAGYYYIRSYRYTDYYIHATLSGKLQTKTTDVSGDPVYSAIWQVSEKGTDGTQTIKNIVTGTYIQSQSSNSSYYTLGSSSYGFTISCYTTSGDTNIYNVWSTYSSTSGNCRGLNIYYDYGVVAWNDASDSGNQWTFTSISLSDSQLSEATALGSTNFSGWYKLSSKVSSYGIMKESDGLLIHEAASTTTSPEYAAIWNVTRTDWGYYTIQNAATGNYIQSQGSLNGQYATGTSAHSFYIVPNSTQSGYYNIFNTKGGYHINIRTWDSAVLAWTNSDCNAENCVWGFTDVSSDVTDAGILAARESYTGASSASSITSGSYYQIYNPSRDTYLSISGIGDDCNLQHLSKKTAGYTPYMQYWQVVDFNSSTGACTLQNVYTSKYMNYIPDKGRAYSCGDTGDTFYIVEGISLMPYVHIKPSTSATWMPHAEDGGAVVNWTAGSAGNISATEWLFKEVTLSSEDIAAAQADYKAKVSLINNASTYASAITKYFTDKACTTLNSTYTSVTDDELKSVMAEDGLPDDLQTMAVKIKNNAWTMTHGTDNASYEKEFRIQNYEAYSNPEYMATRIGVTTFSHCEQPTGIYATQGDVLYVFVGEDDLATGYEMKLEIVAPLATSGSQTTLTAGMNVVIADRAGNVVINYHDTTPSVTSSTTTANDLTETNVLSADNNRTVHIEGGTVNGVFDARTPVNGIGHGHTNDDYATMTSAGLFTQTTTCLRSRNLVFYLAKEDVTTAFEADKTTYGSYKITDVLGVWDKIIDDENDMAAMNDTYITGFSTHCNNIWGVHSVSSGIYAGTYGTHYAGISNEMQFQKMNSNAGILWGPAHENGHLHQGLINIIGDSEVSNNCFSNMCVWKRGYSTTRGYGANSTFDQFNGTDMKRVIGKDSSGKKYSTYTGTKAFYLDFKASDGDGGCWDRTRMYWQLYLYYEVEGHHPNFYQELFAALRADNMKRVADAVNYGKDNYLKFVEKVYEITGDDLTEFFTAYGLFQPIENYYVDDYANYYITTTQDEIDAVKATLANGSKDASNIMFIEDRIEQVDAEYIAAENGVTYRTEFEDGQGVGDCGDVGQYTDFDDDANVKASNYLYSLSGTTVTIDSDAAGAVGYKIYDTSGNLVALYNTNTFDVSQLTDFPTGYVVYAAQADGTDVEIPNSTDTKYTLTAYYGSDDEKTLYVTSAAPTRFAPNTVFVNSDSSAPTTVANSSNVITKGTDDYTAAKFEITDLEDFYTPFGFTATAMTYGRSNTSGWNSVCLPFAVSATDIETYFGTGAKAYTATSATTTEVTLTEVSGTVAAGTPMFVQCADDAADWSISGSSIAIANGATNDTNGSLVVKGSFTMSLLGTGYYKLNSAGTAFVHTTANSNVYPFRCYLELGSALASRLSVRFDDATSISAAEISTATEGQDADAWYDLQGRRVLTPEKGVYIHGGKKVIVR